ncbi:hypothetical protein AB0F72_31420 [Actinoplanes sp. NPDC023936]|uniref:hypothetical protein n=1 Tax=Actinoplanes sp. NPDC023936 TaxID=3154910 RepID=UPI0033EFDA9B
MDAKIEFQRLVGKFALFFAFIYLLMIVGSVVTIADGDSVPVLTWVGILLAGLVFTPAVIDAVRLHRTADPQRLAALWRRSGLLTLAGVAVMILTAVAVEAVST